MENSAAPPATTHSVPWREQATVLPSERPRRSRRRQVVPLDVETIIPAEPAPAEPALAEAPPAEAPPAEAPPAEASPAEASPAEAPVQPDQPREITRPGRHRPYGPRHRTERPADETAGDGHLPEDALLDGQLPDPAVVPQPRQVLEQESWSKVLASAVSRPRTGAAGVVTAVAEGPDPSPMEDERSPGRLPAPRVSPEQGRRTIGGRRRAERRASSDRDALRRLGVPAAWVGRMPDGDRFGGVLTLLENLPEQAIDPATPVVAVIGQPGVVELEAHRTALDLPIADLPRQVVTVPGGKDQERRAALAAARHTRPVVVAIQIPDYDDPDTVASILTKIGVHAVIAVVDVALPIERTGAWLRALGRVDALAVDGALESSAPAAVLGLELPVVRLDGIAVDRVGWAALLCAQLSLIVG